MNVRTDPAMIKSGYERVENNAYMTEEWVSHVLLSKITLRGEIWEPACGDGGMAKIIGADHLSDIADYGCKRFVLADFLKTERPPSRKVLSIVTNPPYGDLAVAFIRHALHLMRPVNGMVAMLLRHEFDCASGRKDIFDHHPAFKMKIVLTKRPHWGEQLVASPRHNYAWFVWDWTLPHDQMPIIEYGP